MFPKHKRQRSFTSSLVVFYNNFINFGTPPKIAISYYKYVNYQICLLEIRELRIAKLKDNSTLKILLDFAIFDFLLLF